MAPALNSAKAGYLPLALVCVLSLYLLAEPLFNGTFYAEKPNNFLAADAYWHLFYVESIREVGNYNSEPREVVGFVSEEITPNEPPLVLYFSAFLANLLGIPSHVAVFFGLILALSLAFSAVYILLARYDFRLAVVASPFFLLSFNFPFIAGITWGFWKAYFGYFVFFFSLLLFPVRFRGSPLVLWALLFGAVSLSHITMLPYFMLVLLLKVLLSPEERNPGGFLKLAGIAAGGGLIASVHIIDFFIRFGGGNASFAGRVVDMFSGAAGYNLGNATPFARDFGSLWYLALLGFGLSCYFALKTAKEKKYFSSVLVLFSLLFVILAAGPMLFGRIYQFRLAWPVVMAVFLGFPVYILLRSVPPLRGRSWPYLAVFLLSLYVLFAFNVLRPPQGDNSVYGGETWAAYKYIADSTPEDAKVLVIDPTMTQRPIVLFTKRYTLFLDSWSFDEMVQENKGILEKELTVFCNTPDYIRKGLGRVSTESFAKPACAKKERRVCEFDYVLLNLQVKRQEEVGLLNGFISYLGQNRYQTVAGGKQTVVLKNPEVCSA